MKLRTILMTSALALLLAAPAMAQDGAQRDINQQDRIAKGVQSGQLTPHETKKLENGEQHIDKVEAHDAKTGDTPAEKARLTRLQNRESRRIDAQKHDAQTTGAAATTP